jgi:signal transduction histidine kinase
MDKYLNIATILYVEDEEDARVQTAKALERYAKKLYVANDGEEGLALYKKYKPDIVITDIIMPNINGIEMSKEIKKIDEHQPIIIISAHCENSYLFDAISLQLNGYILKPIDKNILKNKVLEIIRNKQLEIELKVKNDLLNHSQKMASMSELIENISHHWRQPLSVISTGAGTIQMKIGFDIINNDEITSICDTINNNAQYLSNTIEEFRNYIKDDMKLKTINIKQTIDKFLILVNSTIIKNNLNIILDIQENINIKSCQNNLIQCFINIFNNSVDAFINKKDGDANRYIFISTIIKQNDKITITIKDNATGIDNSIVNTIFDPYTTTKHPSSGVGLSLYMTYNMIVNNMNGNILIENKDFYYKEQQYKGTQISIELPVINEGK